MPAYCGYCLKSITDVSEEKIKKLLSYKNMHSKITDREYYNCPECRRLSIPHTNYTKNVISKIGIEMEGMYYDMRSSSRWIWHQDTSVRKSNCKACNIRNSSRCSCEEPRDHYDDDCPMHCTSGSCTCNYRYVGEFIMHPPIPYSKKEQFIEAVKSAYPDSVNKSCGGHTHFSFESFLYYCLMMDVKFVKGLIRLLREFAVNEMNDTEDMKITLNRLYDGVSYCKKGFDPESQIDSSGDRYTHVNYPFGKHKTVELRVLPMLSNKEDMLILLDRVIDYVDSYVRIEMNNMEDVISTVRYTSNPEFKGRISSKDIIAYYRQKNVEKEVIEV